MYDAIINFFDSPANWEIINDFIEKGLIDSRMEYNETLMVWTANLNSECENDIRLRFWAIGEEADIIKYDF